MEKWFFPGHIFKMLTGYQVDVCGVPECVDLFLERRVDLWMAVSHTDGHDPAKEVKIPLALVVPQVLHRSPGDVEWFAIVRDQSRVQLVLPGFDDLVVGRDSSDWLRVEAILGKLRPRLLKQNRGCPLEDRHRYLNVC